VEVEVQLPLLLLMQEWAALVVVMVAEVLYQLVKVVLAEVAEVVEEVAGMIA